MTDQTEAQRLADELVALHGYPLSIRAAAELRRLDAELERKSDAIQRLWAERDSLRTSMAQLLEALEMCIKGIRNIGLGVTTLERLDADPESFLNVARAIAAAKEQA